MLLPSGEMAIDGPSSGFTISFSARLTEKRTTGEIEAAIRLHLPPNPTAAALPSARKPTANRAVRTHRGPNATPGAPAAGADTWIFPVQSSIAFISRVDCQ